MNIIIEPNVDNSLSLNWTTLKHEMFQLFKFHWLFLKACDTFEDYVLPFTVVLNLANYGSCIWMVSLLDILTLEHCCRMQVHICNVVEHAEGIYESRFYHSNVSESSTWNGRKQGMNGAYICQRPWIIKKEMKNHLFLFGIETVDWQFLWIHIVIELDEVVGSLKSLCLVYAYYV